MAMVNVAAGFAVGYVLGTRAGRDTYEHIVDRARKLSNQPAVKRSQATVEDAASTAADAATAKANAVASSDADKVTSASNNDDKATNASGKGAAKTASTATPIYRRTVADDGSPAT
jgi:hypothetical protein